MIVNVPRVAFVPTETVEPLVDVTTRAPGSSPSTVLNWMPMNRVPSATASGSAVTVTSCGRNQLRFVKTSVVPGLFSSVSGFGLTEMPRIRPLPACDTAAGTIVIRTVSSGSCVSTTLKVSCSSGFGVVEPVCSKTRVKPFVSTTTTPASSLS